MGEDFFGDVGIVCDVWWGACFCSWGECGVWVCPGVVVIVCELLVPFSFFGECVDECVFGVFGEEGGVGGRGCLLHDDGGVGVVEDFFVGEHVEVHVWACVYPFSAGVFVVGGGDVAWFEFDECAFFGVGELVVGGEFLHSGPRYVGLCYFVYSLS